MATILRTTAQISGAGVTDAGLASFSWLPGTPGGSTADATDCLDLFRDFWEAIKAQITFGVTITYDSLVLAYNDANGDLVGAFTGIPGAATVGSAAGDPMPFQTQGLVTWRTTGIVNNRRVAGRTFIPYPVEGASSNGVGPNSTYTTAVAAGITALLAAGATASEPVIWHRPGPGGAGSSYPVTAGVARDQWAVLRSRR